MPERRFSSGAHRLRHPYDWSMAFTVNAPAAKVYTDAPLPIWYPSALVGVWAACGTAPSGGDLVLQLRRNGAEVYAAANRPRILNGSTSSASLADDPSDSMFLPGDVCTLEVVTVSGAAGLVVHTFWRFAGGP
jgi:hypothetical protein